MIAWAKHMQSLLVATQIQTPLLFSTQRFCVFHQALTLVLYTPSDWRRLSSVVCFFLFDVLLFFTLKASSVGVRFRIRKAFTIAVSYRYSMEIRFTAI